MYCLLKGIPRALDPVVAAFRDRVHQQGVCVCVCVCVCVYIHVLTILIFGYIIRHMFCFYMYVYKMVSASFLPSLPFSLPLSSPSLSHTFFYVCHFYRTQFIKEPILFKGKLFP